MLVPGPNPMPSMKQAVHRPPSLRIYIQVWLPPSLVAQKYSSVGSKLSAYDSKMEGVLRSRPAYTEWVNRWPGHALGDFREVYQVVYSRICQGPVLQCLC